MCVAGARKQPCGVAQTRTRTVSPPAGARLVAGVADRLVAQGLPWLLPIVPCKVSLSFIQARVRQEVLSTIAALPSAAPHPQTQLPATALNKSRPRTS